MNPDEKIGNEGSGADSESLQHLDARKQRPDRRNIVVGVAVIALIALTLIVLIVWRLKRSATEQEAEVTPTVSVKVVKAEKECVPRRFLRRHDLATRKS
jgi:hypothetical protein